MFDPETELMPEGPAEYLHRNGLTILTFIERAPAHLRRHALEHSVSREDADRVAAEFVDAASPYTIDAMRSSMLKWGVVPLVTFAIEGLTRHFGFTAALSVPVRLVQAVLMLAMMVNILRISMRMSAGPQMVIDAYKTAWKKIAAFNP